MNKTTDNLFFQVSNNLMKDPEFHKTLSAEEIELLFVIAAYINKNGKCYPSQYQLSKNLSLKRETVTTRFSGIVSKKYRGMWIVKKVQVRTSKGTWKNNIYTINPELGLTIFRTQTSMSAPANTVPANKVEMDTNYNHKVITKTNKTNYLKGKPLKTSFNPSKESSGYGQFQRMGEILKDSGDFKDFLIKGKTKTVDNTPPSSDNERDKFGKEVLNVFDGRLA